MQNYLFLAIAIVAEVIATSALKATDGFTQLIPSVIVVLGYAAAFFFLSLTLRTIPVGIAYATWSGAGIVLVAAIGQTFLNQRIDLAGYVGIAFIVVGVLIVNLVSKTGAH
jgi:multidrug transporter EmrE-like cation transporter